MTSTVFPARTALHEKHDAGLIDSLRRRALEIRIHVVKMVHTARSGHYGGSMSIADLLAVLYFHEMSIDPANPQWQGRDRLVLSKGHAAPALYAALALRGFFPVERLATLRRIDSILQGHPDMRKTPGVDYTTGSLGHGLGVAVGMALGSKLNRQGFRVYAIVGDGEMQEGSIWEAAMAAPRFGLDNLTVIVDYNGLQVEGRVDEIMPIEPIVSKWAAFGWEVREIDGHSVPEILEALDWAKQLRGKPGLIVAHTIKGKGVSFMENQVNWHKGSLDDATFPRALEELEAQFTLGR
ncbi:MAG: transketolase [Firmicutes bacterium]|nr:transketolase [Bacillota bacterium]